VDYLRMTTGAYAPVAERFSNCVRLLPTRLAGVDYSSAGHGVLWLHANKGITFDLDAIRRANPGGKLLRFCAVAGDSENDSAMTHLADIWVFVDGRVRFQRREITRDSGEFFVTVPLADRDRFLTLAATDGGDGQNWDWVMFGDPRLELSVIAASTQDAGEH
jgi:hypothetical protein